MNWFGRGNFRVAPYKPSRDELAPQNVDSANGVS
jgi:hypothetical protein